MLTPPGRRESGRYALESGSRILRACEEYYGVPYPLSKLDLIAVAEHAFGAMENWGAISFQETRLLVDSSSSSFAQRDVFETVAHEIAHQWFGNLVTMSWWDDIWLNESFASLMETVITDRIAPVLDPWTDFFLRTAGMAQAMGGDSLRATHPIRVTVHRPEEISQIFDEISYGKGSSVLAMLNRHLGDDRFRAGVTEYLERFRLRNARTDDLWAALERASGEPVSAIAGPWIDRPGFPVVSARIGPKGLELEQRRFSYLGSHEEDPWPMTMLLDVDGQRQRLRWDTRTLTVPVTPTATIHLNPDGVGFYRVLYDRTLYDRLLTALPSMKAADRWVVLSDLAAFVMSGDADWSTYIRFVRALGATNDRLVVEPICSSRGLRAPVPHDRAGAGVRTVVPCRGVRPGRGRASARRTGRARRAAGPDRLRARPGRRAGSPGSLRACSPGGTGSTRTYASPSRSPGRARKARRDTTRSGAPSSARSSTATPSGLPGPSDGARSPRSSARGWSSRYRVRSTAATSSERSCSPP